MRILSVLLLAVVLVSCEKDKYTDAPQIEFLRFDANVASNFTGFNNQPHMILNVTDANGDLGFKPNVDTAFIYLKNMLTGRVDSSLHFPDLGTGATKNFEAELSVGLFSILGGRDLPSSQRPYSDTLYFEIYIKDFAKNKSNVILTTEPFIYHTLP